MRAKHELLVSRAAKIGWHAFVLAFQAEACRSRTVERKIMENKRFCIARNIIIGWLLRECKNV